MSSITWSDFDLPFGELEQHEVYFFHEIPRLLTLSARNFGLKLITNCVADDEREDGSWETTYLARCLPQGDFLGFRSGTRTLRDAFTLAPDGTLYTLVLRGSEDGEQEYSARPTPAIEVPEAWLPAVGAALKLPTATAQEFSSTELEDLSDQSGRSMVALEFKPERITRTEFPIAERAKSDTALQSIAARLAVVNRAKPIPGRPAAREVILHAVGDRAASYVELLAVDVSESTLMEDSELVGRVLNGLQELVANLAQPDTLLAYLEKAPRGVAGHAKSLLEVLKKTRSGLSVHTRPIGAKITVSSVTLDNALAGLAEFERDAARTVVDISRGTLLGLDVSSETFRVLDSGTGIVYAGHIAPAYVGAVDGLEVGTSSFVRASVAVDQPLPGMPGFPQHVLLELAPTPEAGSEIAADVEAGDDLEPRA